MHLQITKTNAHRAYPILIFILNKTLIKEPLKANQVVLLYLLFINNEK